MFENYILIKKKLMNKYGQWTYRDVYCCCSYASSGT